MRVLLVDGDHTDGEVVAGQLHQAGHEVVRCFGADDAHLCRGVALHEECPVDSGSVDVALLVRRDGAAPQLREMGAVCAVRHRVPVVEAHPSDGSPFAGFATPAGDSVVEAVEKAVTDDLGGHELAVQAVLVTVPAVVRLGVVPGVRVRRDGRRLVLGLTADPSLSDDDVNAVVTWGVRALRDYDPFAQVVDVIVDRGPRPPLGP